MPDPPQDAEEEFLTLPFPTWLREAATAAAARKGMDFGDLMCLLAYEYAERHAPDPLSAHKPPQEQLPFAVRMANYLLTEAIDRGASEVSLVPEPDQEGPVTLKVRFTGEGHASELVALPAHVRPQLYNRFVFMASCSSVRREARFAVTHNGIPYNVLVSWDGDYRSEMALTVTREPND